MKMSKRGGNNSKIPVVVLAVSMTASHHHLAQTRAFSCVRRLPSDVEGKFPCLYKIPAFCQEVKRSCELVLRSPAAGEELLRRIRNEGYHIQFPSVRSCHSYRDAQHP
jgi:hypothetical protein